MSSLMIRKFASLQTLNTFLRGGLDGGAAPPWSVGVAKAGTSSRRVLFGLHGKTLVFTSPVHTVTFSDPTDLGLTATDIVNAVDAVFNDAAATTPGSVNLTGAFPVLVAQTIKLNINNAAVDNTVTLASPANKTELLSQVNAALNPLGVIASLGAGDGLVLTTTLLGVDAVIDMKGTGTANVLLGLATEVVTGTTALLTRFMDGRLSFEEGTPSSGVALGPTSTAAQFFGFSGAPAGVVYAPYTGAAPRMLSVTASGQMDSVLLVTEE